MKKKLLILGAGGINNINSDFVRYAKEMGVHTIVADFHPYENSQAKQNADEHWDISTADIDTICQKVVAEKIDGVTACETDFSLQKAQEVCERLSLPFYATKEQLLALTDKSIFSDLLRDGNLPVLEKYYYGSISSLEHINCLEFPLIIKPSDASGGRGVHICYDRESMLRYAVECSKLSSNSDVLLEKFMDCEEVGIYYVVIDGEIKLTSMADRVVTRENENCVTMPRSYDFPSKYLDSYLRNFNEKMVAALSKLNLKSGVIFMQAFWDNGQCYVYDVGYRITGTQIYLFLDKICGYNTMKMLINHSLTGSMIDKYFNMDVINPYYNNKFASNLTFLCKCGVQIDGIEGIDEAKQIEGVEDIILCKKIGDYIPNGIEGTQSQVFIRAILVCDSAEDLAACKVRVRSVIRAYDINGNNILL